MKKFIFKILLCFVVICRCSILWALPDLFDNYSHYFSYEKETFTTGLKIGLSFAEGRFATDFKGNYNYGLSVFSDNYFKNFPMKCQMGNLSIGGIISKLNNPLIDSSTDGLGGCYSEPDIITSTLPSYTYFTKPFSTFIEAGWENEKTVLQEVTINGAYVPDSEDLSFSSKIKLGFTDKFGITNTFGFSIFTLEENISNYWYLSIPYYRKSGNFCFAGQLALDFFNFSSNFSIFSYKSPFLDNKGHLAIENIYRTDNKFETEYFSIGISALFNNNKNIISRENKVLSPCTQIKTNMKYKLNFGDNDEYSIKAGITAYGNILAEKKSEDDIKFGISTSASSPFTSVILEGNFSYKLFEDSKKMILKFFSANIENIWNLGFFTPLVGVSSQYYISDENHITSKNYHINVIFNLWGDTITNNNCFSFSVKDNIFCNKKIKTGLNLNFSYKKLLISVKIAGEFCI